MAEPTVVKTVSNIKVSTENEIKSPIEINYPFFSLSFTIFDIASKPTALIPPKA